MSDSFQPVSPWTDPAQWPIRPKPGSIFPQALDPRATIALPDDDVRKWFKGYAAQVIRAGSRIESACVTAISEVTLAAPPGTAQDAWELVMQRQTLRAVHPHQFVSWCVYFIRIWNHTVGVVQTYINARYYLP